MGIDGITFNGRRYSSPDAMPPDVRRQYDEVMRAIGPILTGGKASETNRMVPGGPDLPGVQNDIVVTRTVTVDSRTYESLDEMPPEVRRLVEHRIQGAEAPVSDPGKAGLDLSFHIDRSNVRPSLGALLPDAARPIEPARDQARQLLSSLVFWVVVALILWALLGR